MRVHVLDPSAYTPPYDRALAAALAAAGADVRLTTSAFTAGDVPPAPGVAVDEGFYGRVPAGRARVGVKLARHVPAMLRAARVPADVVHFQWLAVQPVDLALLRAFRAPTVLTAHDVLPREPPGRRELMRAAQARLYRAVDAVVVHSEHGRRRLVDDVGLDPARIHAIPHGVLELPAGGALPHELRDTGEPVVLLAGLLRAYKGIDVLLEAWRGVTGAQLWIAGLPRMDPGPLRAAAAREASISLVERFVSDAELGALLARADLVVLPYRDIDQSGVLFAALGAGRPLVLSDVGGFPEVAATGAARVVPAGDAGALRTALTGLLGDDVARAAMAERARRAAAERYGWGPIARAHLDLYERLVR
ncbi:MAG: glycosyltransferase [Solirubrobacteraceae bacterium]